MKTKKLSESVEIEVSPEEIIDSSSIEESVEIEINPEDRIDEKRSKGRKIEICESDLQEARELLTEGSIYPVELDSGASDALEEKLKEILGGDVEINKLELIPAKGWVDNTYWYKANINISDENIIYPYINETDTPILNKLKNQNDLIINVYSDIDIRGDEYSSGLTFDWHIDNDDPVDETAVDKETDKISDKIIEKLKEHEDEIVEFLKDYEITDEEDWEWRSESKKMKKEEYIPNHLGEKCPKCGSNNYVQVDTDEDGYTGEQFYKLVCSDCGYESEEDTYGLDESKHLDLDEKSFNSALTKFIKENYKNAVNLRISKVVENKSGLKLECRLKIKDKATVPVILEAKGKITDKNFILKVYENKIIKHEDKDKNIMTMIVSNTNGLLKLEKLKYNFNTRLTEGKRANVSGIIK